MAGHDRGPLPTLRELRLARGLSVRDLARRAAVSRETVSRIERGETRPRPYIARLLAAALGVLPAGIAELADAVPRLGAERSRPAPDADPGDHLGDGDQRPALARGQEPPAEAS